MLPTLRTLLPRRLPRSILLPALQSRVAPPSRPLSTGGKDLDDPWSSWNGGAPSDPASSWSTGLTKDHFDGDAVGHQIPSTPAADDDPRAVAAAMDEEDDILRALDKDNKESKAFVDSWDERYRETCKLLKQVREPGIRGEYLKSTEKDEMYRLHKENLEVYTVEKLAKDYRTCGRQRWRRRRPRCLESLSMIPSTTLIRASLQVRNLSSVPGQANDFYAKIAKSMGDSRSDNSLETADEFERRLFGSIDDVSSTDSFYRKLDKLEKARGRSNMGSKMGNGGNSQFNEDGMDGGYNTLADGMDAKLKKAASTFVSDDEIGDDYQYRPDVTFKAGMTYTPRDLDLTKPGIQRAPPQRPEFETTTADVLKKADFRNVKFLAHFITEAGIIIKRSQTKISAKAQRKVAREIKTARAFGLMPFTTMGRKRFVYGRTAKVDDEQEFETYSSNNMPEAVEASEES